MKIIKLSALLVLALAMTFAATGCKKKPVNTTVLPGSRTGTPDGDKPITDTQPPIGSGSDVTGGGIALDSSWSVDQFNQDPTALAPFTVYFALDSSVVRSDEQTKVDAVADALKSDMQARLLIEGHCDERGTEEYNRSLGERRALSLRETLAGKNIDPNRIKTLSFGEDRPAVQGHNEAAWSKNRRGVFILLHPK